MIIKRSLKFSLGLANARKEKQLTDLWTIYQLTVNTFFDRLFAQHDLSEDYIKDYESPLSYRYKQCAKRQAFKIFKCWCRNKEKGEKPYLKNSMTLDYRFVELQENKSSSFDYWVKIATMDKGKPISIPIKSYDYANKYFNDWQLIKGGKLLNQDNQWFLILTFQKEVSVKIKGKPIGIDIGIKKLIVDSNGKQYGKDMERLMDKIQRKEQNSKAFKRALKERNNYIGKTVKTLNLSDKKVLVAEAIKNIKRNTKKDRRLHKRFRAKFQRWVYALLLRRIQLYCEVVGVQFYKVEPSYTSQTCNKCKFVSRANRVGELFKCRNCGYTADADYNASLNILNLYLAQENIVPANKSRSYFTIK